jgi:hypothetical protein
VTLAELAVAQHAVAHVDQLVALGLTRATVRGRVAAGLWRPVLPGVVALHPGPLGDEARQRAVTLWLPHGTLCGPTAGRLHGIRAREPAVVHVAVTRGHPRGPEWVSVRRLRDLPDDHVVVIRGLRVTSPARTLVDVHEITRGRAQRRALAIEAVQRGVTTAVDVICAATTTPGLDHRSELGATMLHVLDGAQSLAEVGFVEFCAAWGLPKPRAQFPVLTRLGTLHVDHAFVRERVAVEVDGYAGHAFDHQRRRDHERDLALAALGWVVVRVEPRRVADDAALLHADLARLLAERSRAAS